MAHYNLQDADELIPCPYNRFEMITVRRMPQHLVRCPHRKAIGIEFETCPYNAMHIIPRCDYRQHLNICPSRVVAEKVINYELEKQNDNLGRVKIKGCTDVPEYNKYEIQCSENWDEDEDGDEKPNFYQFVPNTVPDNVSEKSEMDSGIDVQELSEVEFNDLDDRRSTRISQEHGRRQSTPVRKPKQAPQVFQYSLRMAGVKPGHSLPGQSGSQVYLNDSGMGDSGMGESLSSEVFEDEIFEPKPLDVRPKVRQNQTFESGDVRPKERQNQKYESGDVRPKERQNQKYESADVRPKVKQVHQKEASDHFNVRSNSRACSNPKFERISHVDAGPKIGQPHGANSDFQSSPQNLNKISEQYSEIHSSPLYPGVGRGAILQYLLSNKSQKPSLTNHAPMPKAPMGDNPVSKPIGLGRGALAQYILGKIPSESTSSSNTKMTPIVTPQGPGPGMFAQVLKENRAPATDLKVTPQEIERGMLSQSLKDNRVPATDLKVTPPKIGLKDYNVPATQPKDLRFKESEDEEDFIPKFEGIGRGTRLKNGNQDPRLYPPSLGSGHQNNKNFEYAKN